MEIYCWLPVGVKLYCRRHDFGTELLQRTGILSFGDALMGQTSTEAAMLTNTRIWNMSDRR
ncbi:MAG TPA: hypothetical protein VFT65_20225 [Candidatus Angelobacter sp.]|nr:hypothetical protein [Candidatus Angelobacter sp.]